MLESGAAIRTAEGGAEHVEPITGDSFIDTLDQFRKAGYAIVSTSSHNGTPLFKAELPKKMVLVLGRNVMVCPMRRFPAPIQRCHRRYRQRRKPERLCGDRRPAGGMVASEQGVIRLPECKKPADAGFLWLSITRFQREGPASSRSAFRRGQPATGWSVRNGCSQRSRDAQRAVMDAALSARSGADDR